MFFKSKKYIFAVLNYQIMENLFRTYGRLLEATDLSFTRYLYPKINWENRLIVIKGAKGVGNTTMILQHIKRSFPKPETALYVSLDNIWFANHSLTELVEYHYTHGGTHLFMDEVHKYKNWQQEVKNIYDSYPDYHLVLTGSSMLKINEHLTADLSRRYRGYTMEGLSFREYLQLEGVASLDVISFEDILKNHFTLASQITSKVKVLLYFERYLRTGFYPFYRDEGDGFFDRLQQTIENIVSDEIPSVGKIEYDSVYKAKQFLGILAETTPYTLNISSMCNVMQTSRNNALKLIDLLDSAALIRRLYAESSGVKMLVKPEKILFANTNLMYALSGKADAGTVRETFLASQLAPFHRLAMPQQGDLQVDDKWLFEVGGKKKKFSQIKGIEDSFVVSDDLEIGYGNKIPLWLFGLMY